MELFKEIGHWLWAVGTIWQAYMTGGIIVMLLGFYERITNKPISLRTFFCGVATFLLVAFFLAWRDQYHTVLVLKSKFASPRFEGRITALSSASTPSGTLLIVGGILMNPSGRPSAAIDWQIHIEFNSSSQIVGQIVQEPDVDKNFTTPNGVQVVLKHENWWPNKAAQPIAPGGVAGDWLWALFPNLSENEIYQKHAIVVVDFRDAVMGEWHHISMVAPEKGLHMPPVI